jgi:hypothetical protein
MKTFQFPRHDVNPAEKAGKAWLKQFAEAALRNYTDADIHVFANKAREYGEWALYAMGKQSISKYKPMLGIEEQETKSFYATDWTPQSLIPKFRDIGLSVLEQRPYHIAATPIDPLAKDLLDDYFSQAKVLINLKQVAEKVGDPSILNSPALVPEEGMPEDMDEFQLDAEFGGKLKVAKMAENGVELVFYQSDMTQCRQRVLASLWDRGVGGLKDYIDENGNARVRDVDMSRFISNFCRKKDFSDLLYAGELTEVPLVELAGCLEDEDMKTVVNQVSKGSINPQWSSQDTQYNRGYDGLNATVLDLELLSDDDVVYETRYDSVGNEVTGRANWMKRFSKSKVTNPDGNSVPKYTVKRRTNVYKVKWVVGTDVVYDYGLATNMKREPIRRLLGKTSLSYHICAVNNFKDMTVQSMLERMIPIEDEHYLTRMKLKNLKARMTPSGWSIDLDGLENVSLEKGGKAMSKKAVLKMYFQTGILLYRKSNLNGDPNNSRIIDAMPSEFGNELMALAQELERLKGTMRDITGLNEFTDGSTPKERSLVQVGQMAQAATNNALYPLIEVDKNLLERAAKGAIMRLQNVVREQGNVAGVTMALGSDVVKYINITGDIAPHVWGIKIQDIPNDEERSMMLQQMGMKDAQGMISPEDYAMLWEIKNPRQQRQYLALRVRKREKQKQADDLQKIQTQNQGLVDLEKQKIQTAREMSQLKINEINAQGAWDYVIKTHSTQLSESMKRETQYVMAQLGGEAGAEGSQMVAQGPQASGQAGQPQDGQDPAAGQAQGGQAPQQAQPGAGDAGQGQEPEGDEGGAPEAQGGGEGGSL